MLLKRFEEQVNKNPGKIAIKTINEAITYEELNKQANRVANLLENNQVRENNQKFCGGSRGAVFQKSPPGRRRQEITGLLFDKAIPMIVGMLGTLKAGCAYIPLPPDYPEERLRYMITHSGLSSILTDCRHMEFAGKLAAGTGAAVRDIGEAGLAGGEYPGTGFDDDRLMYILYTSGSTGNPKGVKQTCGNVLHFIDRYTENLSITGNDRLTLLSSFSHDAAIMDIYGALLNGVTLFPLDIKEQSDFFRISRWLVREGITIWHSVPTVYRYFVNSLPNGEHFPGLRLMVLGGEAVRSHDVEMFKQRFSHAALYNLYGQTESSYNSGKFFTKEIPADTITIGETVEGTRIFLIREDGTKVNALETGEIVIASPHVSPGYWQDEEATGSSFRNHPKLGSLYRTGDLGRLLLDGSIEFAGRKDNQVKIRGFRVEPVEIENRLLKHEKVKEAVVIARESAGADCIAADGTGDTYLCGYIVGKGVGEAELKNHLSGLLPNYMIPASFVLLDRLPVTESGKLNRKALPEPGSRTGNRYAAPRNSLEEQLVEIWSEVLLESQGAIGIDDNFFSLGGHSLKAITLVSRTYERLKVKISLTQLLQSPTIRGVADYIQSSVKKEIEYPAAAPDKENLYRPFPLTDIQMTYLLGRSSHFEMGGVSTHGYKEFTAKLDLQRLNKSLNKVIKRHPMLRAVIREDGQQSILQGDLEYQIQVEDLGHLDAGEQEKQIAEEREQKSHYVFKTDEWPLFHIKAFKLAEDTYRLCIGEDRIIMDNFSSRIVVSEIMMFYLNPELELPELEFSFRDYTMAYKGLENSEIYTADRDYWLNRLDDFPAAPALPLKCDPSDIKKPRFKRFIEEFSPGEWEDLKKIAGKYHITPSVLLCTVYAEVLAYWSNQLRFALNLTLFNRYPFHPDVNRLVGDFTSLILLEIDWKPGSIFAERAGSLQNVLFEAIEHRHYDGVRFIRQISRHRRLGNKAVMPIVFTALLFDNTGNREEQGKEYQFSQEENFAVGSDDRQHGQDSYFSSQTSQAFIDNVVSDANGSLTVSWNFVDDLFDEGIISTMFEQYLTRLKNLVKGNISDVSHVPDRDKQLWEEYNRTAEAFPCLTLHQLFSHQAKTTPHNTALVHRDKIITYKELDERSNRAARYLREQGIGPGDFIGLEGTREINTIINVFGILKSGAAYVPLDPEYPRERIDYILHNSRCKLLLDPGLYRSKNIDRYPVEKIENRNSADDIGYVIYTSGSTGKPKGVVITHRAVTNTLIDINRKFNVKGKDRVIAVSSLCFDLSVYDIFGTLSSGAACIIIEDQRDIDHLQDILQKQQITFWNSVPSIMDLVVNRAGAQEERDNVEDQRVRREDGEEIFYWSPVESWQKNGNAIQIGAHSYRGAALEVFPELVSLTKKGIPIKRLPGEFPGINLKQLNDLVEDLVRQRVLVNSILSPQEIFNPRNKLFKNENYKQENNKKLLRGGLNQWVSGSVGQWDSSMIGKHSNESLIMMPRPHPETNENQHQRFAQHIGPPCHGAPGKISFEIFSSLLSLFKQTRDQDEIRYYFASAGGLYPIDIYVYIKKETVENIEEGLYYYNPGENALHLVYHANNKPVIPGEVYDVGNPSIFQSSALSIYMIYNADVTMPKYEGLGYFIASIDAGIMTGTLSMWSEHLGIDVCPVGQIDFQRIRPYFHLEKNQVYIQSLELRLKTGKTKADDVSSREILPGLKIETDSFPHKAHEIDPVSPAPISPGEIFAAQNRLFENKYSKAILVIPEEYEKFKKHQLSRVYGVNSGEKILLQTNGELPSFIKERRSYRDFDETSPISSVTLSRLLGVFKEVGLEGALDYYYETVAGTYTIDIFVYVKKYRVENLEAGLYYYNPGEHSLHLVDEVIFPAEVHFPGNRSIFQSSAFSIFMLYDGKAETIVGENGSLGALGYFKAGIHCGTAVAALTKVSELSGIGLCSIGNMDFQKIKDYFHIGPNHVFLHALELGLKPVTKDRAGYGSAKAGDILSLESHETRQKEELIERNRSLRWVLLSGDWIPPALPGKIEQVFKNAEVISLGGATEGSIWSIYYPIKEVKKEWKSIPYGFPLANQAFYVLNYESELCPVDVPGELYIGGVGLAQEYIDDEEKTKNSFIIHPELGRIYKTGDYGVFRKQGYIEFLGRRDSQIKIRGYRVELGEIETCLCQHEMVKQAVVIDGEDSSRKKYLCAYIVSQPGKKVPTSELRTFLAGKLPAYMIPAYFIYLEEIPLTQNGKVNRRALPTPGESVGTDVEYAEPGTDMEKALVTLCREMFKLDRISIYDNFFDLGATSLDILQLRNKLKEVYRVDIPILKMFEYSTISSFSFYLSGKIPGLDVNENKERVVLKEPVPQPGETQRRTAENQAKNRFRQRMRKRNEDI